MKTKLLFRTLLIIFIVTVILPFSIEFSLSQERYDLEGIDVAIYNDSGTEGITESYIALKNMFLWMNASVDYISVDQIQQDELKNYDLLCIPGGNPFDYEYALDTIGKNNIRNFVKFGGSYFGICGGSIFGTENFLNFFHGTLIAPLPEIGLGIQMKNMTINRNSDGPDLSEQPENCTTLYWGSGYFEANHMSQIIPITFYPENSESGMIAFKYGSGTVFLCSPHPEFEENTARDGTTRFDNYDDPDSEWDLMLQVSIWLVNMSWDMRPLIWLGIIVGVVGIGLIITSSIYLLKRKRAR
ncbi:MAG: BPL-N domain-containing protein [Candidatus Heimdallarchaeota archaeon]